MDMKSILTTLDVLNQQKAKSADEVIDEAEKEKCRYCGGDCPNDEDNACDGYLGDIDGLYDVDENVEVDEEEVEEELTLEELEALEEDELEEAMVSVDDFDDRPASNYKLKGRSEEEIPGGTLRKSKYEREDGEFTEKQIKMAFGILNDPRYKGGNLSAAIEAIEGIAPGLSEHPAVQRAMLATMESVEVEEGLVKPDGEVIGVAKKENELSRIAKLAGLEEGLFGGYKTRQEQLDAQEAEAMGKPVAKPKKDEKEKEVEEGNDMVPYADPELDFEGDMAKNQLARITIHSEHLASMLDDNENLPEWVQSKITKALDYISTAHDYLMGERRKD